VRIKRLSIQSSVSEQGERDENYRMGMLDAG
jgi:hypothetical protein